VGGPADGVPEAGAMITIQFTHLRPIRNMSPQKVKRITYRRPQNAANGQPPVQAQAPAEFTGTQVFPNQPQPVPGPQFNGAPQGYTQQPQQQPYAPPPQQPLPTTAGAPPYQGAPPQAQPPAEATPPQAPPQPPAPPQGAPQPGRPEGMTDEQWGLLQRLIPGGGQAPAPQA
jgi:hypothetical protein